MGPMRIAPAALALGLYAIEPLNFAIRFIGVADEFILPPLALHGLLQRLPMTIRGRFDRRLVTA